MAIETMGPHYYLSGDTLQLATKRHRVLEALHKTPGLFSYSSIGSYFSITEDRKSGIRVNVKQAWGSPVLMSGIVSLMRDVVSDKTFHTVVGIESGGSPLAAHLAAQLPTGLRLIRKNQTELKSILAGPSDEIVGNVLVVDDVLGKGDSLARTLDVIKNMANGVTFLSVFSYGAESQLSTKLGVSVKSLYGVQELVDCETDHNCRSIARLALDEYRKKLGIVS